MRQGETCEAQTYDYTTRRGCKRSALPTKSSKGTLYIELNKTSGCSAVGELVKTIDNRFYDAKSPK